MLCSSTLETYFTQDKIYTKFNFLCSPLDSTTYLEKHYPLYAEGSKFMHEKYLLSYDIYAF